MKSFKDTMLLCWCTFPSTVTSMTVCSSCVRSIGLRTASIVSAPCRWSLSLQIWRKMSSAAFSESTTQPGCVSFIKERFRKRFGRFVLMWKTWDVTGHVSHPPASGWVPNGAAVPVPGLAHVSRYTHFQTLLPQTGSSGRQMAGRVWWRRRTHRSPLPVRALKNTTQTAVLWDTCTQKNGEHQWGTTFRSPVWYCVYVIMLHVNCEYSFTAARHH